MSEFNLTRRSLLGAAGLTGIVLISACSPDSGEPADPTTNPTSGDTTDSTSTSAPAELVDVKYTLANGAMADAAMVAEAVNALAAAKGRSYKLTIEALDFETFNQRIPLDLNTGNELDAVWTASWANNFYANVANGNFLALNELLDGPASALKEAVPEQAWAGATVGGEILAIPNIQLFTGTWGVLVDQAIADELGMNLDNVTVYEDMTEWLTAAHAAHPDKVTLYSDQNGNGIPFCEEHYGWDVAMGNVGVAVHIDDAECKAFNFFDTDEARKYAKLAYDWRQAGFYEPSPPSNEDAEARWAGQQVMARFNQANRMSSQPFPMLEKDLIPQHFVGTGSIVATMNAVAQTAEHPEAVLQLLEDMHTDEEIYNTLCYGIEGTHWEWEDEELRLVKFPDGVTAENSTYNPNAAWMMGNVFNSYYNSRPDAETKRWEREQQLNAEAKESSLMGFNFNPESVETEVATISGIVTERRAQVFLGLVEPEEGIADVISRLNAAGMEKLLAEIQRQIDEWLASK